MGKVENFSQIENYFTKRKPGCSTAFLPHLSYQKFETKGKIHLSKMFNWTSYWIFNVNSPPTSKNSTYKSTQIKSQVILILTCWIWQIFEQRVPVKLTDLGRDNFSVDILLPPAFEIAFQAAEFVKMSSWNNARGFGPLKKKKKQIIGCQKNVKDFCYAILVMEKPHLKGRDSRWVSPAENSDKNFYLMMCVQFFTQ